MADKVTPFREEVQGMAGFGLRSETIEVLIVPELGARVLRLRSLSSGSDWMWHPPGALRPFRNEVGDSFENSTLAGMDECLPTITPCEVAGRQLADHGEAWASEWEIDEAAWRRHTLRTRVRLPVSPFSFERSIYMCSDHLRFDYRIRNLSEREETFLWACHPLLSFLPGDRIEFPRDVHWIKSGARIESGEETRAVDPNSLKSGCMKVFADFTGCGEAWGAIVRGASRLSIHIDPAEIPYIGLWLTREGWHGFTHAALEPTNIASDTLADANGSPFSTLPPGAERRWLFRVRIKEAGPEDGA